VRYYTVKIVEPDAPETATPIKEFSSYVNGRNVPSALDIEMDIPVTYFADPMGGAYVRIWGIDIKQLVQASDFNGKSIRVYGGMQKGLPLAKPGQNGLLAAGTIQQAFGNWIGTEMTLDLVFTAGNPKQNVPVNVTIDWKKDTPLSVAIENTLRVAFPDYQREINISENLKLPSDQPGFYGTMLQFSKYIFETSRAIIKDDSYRGVQILLKERKFIVLDGTKRTNPKKIDYTDLIGQITWLSSASVSLTAVLRADLQSGDFVSLPPFLGITTPQSFSQARTTPQPFKGVWQITSCRHTGRFRFPGATSWVTVIEATGPIGNG
jgi:hypothetical protein